MATTPNQVNLDQIYSLAATTLPNGHDDQITKLPNCLPDGHDTELGKPEPIFLPSGHDAP
jgi:hypothetical protein